MSALTEAVERVLGGFRNWHGSPHDFERFDFSKMGSGEGNQTFGWGGYTADQRDVGEAYQKRLAAKGDTFRHPSFGVVAPAKVEEYLASVGRRADPKRYGDLKARATAQQILASSAPIAEQRAGVAKGTYPDQKGWLAMLDEFAPFQRQQNPGRLYEVDIAGDPRQDFMYHDRPIAFQPPKVQDAFRDLRVDPETMHFRPGGTMDTGRISYMKLAGKKGSAKAASQALLDRGVSGIRYLDQGSRGVGVNTYNTITFSDKLISIVKKYGIAALLSGGYISQEMADELKRQGMT